MPELPEVETSKKAMVSYLLQQPIIQVNAYRPTLRYPIAVKIQKLANSVLVDVTRRAKYLIVTFVKKKQQQQLIIHLGMSGSLRVDARATARRKHDHVEFIFANNILRYHDPRRFGCICWFDTAWQQRLQRLGVEPLSDACSPKYMFSKTQVSQRLIKPLLMDQSIVVGIGNIYANEALFRAGVLPQTPAKLLSYQQCVAIIQEIKYILDAAISVGGTTLKDFVSGNGKPGYFAQQLFVYGRANQPCYRCGTSLQTIKQSQRASFFCSVCQI